MAPNSKDTEWFNLKKWIENEINQLREQNDSDLDEKETATLRGRIQFAKEVLARGDAPEANVRVTDQSYIE